MAVWVTGPAGRSPASRMAGLRPPPAQGLLLVAHEVAAPGPVEGDPGPLALATGLRRERCDRVTSGRPRLGPPVHADHDGHRWVLDH
jgi:hypothetical protein